MHERGFFAHPAALVGDEHQQHLWKLDVQMMRRCYMHVLETRKIHRVWCRVSSMLHDFLPMIGSMSRQVSRNGCVWMT